MSRQWMYMTDRRSMEFIGGVHEFIKVAENHKYGGFVCCPCKNCKNEKDYSSSRTIHSHLFNSSFKNRCLSHFSIPARCRRKVPGELQTSALGPIRHRLDLPTGA